MRAWDVGEAAMLRVRSSYEVSSYENEINLSKMVSGETW